MCAEELMRHYLLGRIYSALRVVGSDVTMSRMLFPHIRRFVFQHLSTDAVCKTNHSLLKKKLLLLKIEMDCFVDRMQSQPSLKAMMVPVL